MSGQMDVNSVDAQCLPEKHQWSTSTSRIAQWLTSTSRKTSGWSTSTSRIAQWWTSTSRKTRKAQSGRRWPVEKLSLVDVDQLKKSGWSTSTKKMSGWSTVIVDDFDDWLFLGRRQADFFITPLKWLFFFVSYFSSLLVRFSIVFWRFSISTIRTDRSGWAPPLGAFAGSEIFFRCFFLSFFFFFTKAW